MGTFLAVWAFLRRIPWWVLAIILAVLWLGVAFLNVYDKRYKVGYAAGRDYAMAQWAADTVKRDKADADSITAARIAEAEARRNNEVIVNEYIEKVAAASGDADRYFRLLQQARGQVRACRASEATGALIAATAGEASIAERIDRAIAAVIVEHKLNADQLDALIAVLKPQL